MNGYQLFKLHQKLSSQPTKKPNDKKNATKFDMKPNIRFVCSPPGILLIINKILLLIAWVIIARWKSQSILYSLISNSVSFFMATTVIPWLIIIVLFLLYLFNVTTKIPINWPLTLLAHCIFWVILIMISSIIIAINARKHHEPGLAASSAFGFISCLGLSIEGIFHFTEYRS
ncbi:plasmolipin isoform X1 [Hydra vulgaris]|uniref:plasmolipin isoform X1 n=1 Tax=Hydra vulgaris TaxID=6087 RepID=UPI0001924A69|nr:plasmolipin [Hydra vulgaris]